MLEAMPDQSSYIGMLLRKIVRRFVRIYYPAIHVSHPERLPREGATLYIANHSNSLIDPVIIGITADRPVTASTSELPRAIRSSARSAVVIETTR